MVVEGKEPYDERKQGKGVTINVEILHIHAHTRAHAHTHTPHAHKHMQRGATGRSWHNETPPPSPPLQYPLILPP